MVGSRALSDEAFLQALRSRTLPAASFRHGDHLRFAWILLHRYPFQVALLQVRDGIKGFAAHLGADGLFHETMTRAWVSLLATHKEESFEEFFEQNQTRLSARLLHRFWKPETLASERARASWVPPDRQLAPEIFRD